MRSQKLKIWAAVLTILVLLAAGTGAVYAYLSASSGPVNNTFTPKDSVDPAVSNSTFAVQVGNTGYAVYVRAAVIVTWKNDAGEVYGQMPVPGTDYTIVFNTDTNGDWFKSGEFYYYEKRVNSGGSTSALISSYTPGTQTPSGYTLHVEIISQTIQAVGTTDVGNTPAVTAAWGVTVGSDGNLTNE